MSGALSESKDVFGYVQYDEFTASKDEPLVPPFFAAIHPSSSDTFDFERAFSAPKFEASHHQAYTNVRRPEVEVPVVPTSNRWFYLYPQSDPIGLSIQPLMWNQGTAALFFDEVHPVYAKSDVSLQSKLNQMNLPTSIESIEVKSVTLVMADRSNKQKSCILIVKQYVPQVDIGETFSVLNGRYNYLCFNPRAKDDNPLCIRDIKLQSEWELFDNHASYIRRYSYTLLGLRTLIHHEKIGTTSNHKVTHVAATTEILRHLDNTLKELAVIYVENSHCNVYPSELWRKLIDSLILCEMTETLRINVLPILYKFLEKSAPQMIGIIPRITKTSKDMDKRKRHGILRDLICGLSLRPSINFCTDMSLPFTQFLRQDPVIMSSISRQLKISPLLLNTPDHLASHLSRNDILFSQFRQFVNTTSIVQWNTDMAMCSPSSNMSSRTFTKLSISEVVMPEVVTKSNVYTSRLLVIKSIFSLFQ